MRRVLVLLLTFVCFSSVTQFAQVSGQTFRPVVRGRRGVVAGGHPLAVEAGMRILQQGGNAVDAGVATILAGSVIEFSHFSFGGEVPILIKLKGKPVAVVEGMGRSEEHTSELQSRLHLVCRLLLEKKNARTARVRRVGRRS